VKVTRVLVVVNADARGGAGALLDEVVERCRDLGYEPEVLSPRGADRAAHDIAEAITTRGHWRAVIAVGGDGTARTVAEGLACGLGRLPAGSGATETACAAATRRVALSPERSGHVGPSEAPPLFVVPGGTGNSVYRALWEDRPWPEVMQAALSGNAKVRNLDLLCISETGSFSLLGASAGLVAEAVHVSETLAGVSGRDLYQAAAITALEQHEPFPAIVSVDGVVLHQGATTLVAIGGARHRSGTFQLLPLSVLDDGLLDVCVIRGVDAGAFVDLAGVVAAGEHIGRPEVSYAQGRSVTIGRTDSAPLRFEHDGDLWQRDDSTLTIQVVAAAVPVFAPVVPVAG